MYSTLRRIGIAGFILLAATLIQAPAQNYSVAAGPPGSGFVSPSGLLPDDIHVPGGGVLLPGAGPILPQPGPPAPYIDVDAISFGRPAQDFVSIAQLEFSVSALSVGPVGLGGSAVAAEAAGGPGGPGDHIADMYRSLPGTNLLLWDGDGAPNPTPGPALGLLEPGGDDVDGWANTPFQDVVYFSVDIPSAPPAYGVPPFSASDVYLYLAAPGAYDAPGAFAVYAPAPALGLDLVQGANTDELNALVVFDNGNFTWGDPTDVILFSLATGSPALGGGGAYAGAGAEDVLIATPAGPGGVYATGATLGLAVGADIDALAVVIPEPVTGALLLGGLVLVAMLRRRR